MLQRGPIADHRGYFERMFCDIELEPVLATRQVRQINRSSTAKRATIRGMHFQHSPHAEMKLITCLRGQVFDVAVDIRRGSPTFLRWHGELLTAENYRTLIVPEGVAHGFQTLTENCELLYLHTAAYEASSEDGLHPGDPQLGIHWPEPIVDLSTRDGTRAFLSPSFAGIDV